MNRMTKLSEPILVGPPPRHGEQGQYELVNSIVFGKEFDIEIFVGGDRLEDSLRQLKSRLAELEPNYDSLATKVANAIFNDDDCLANLQYHCENCGMQMLESDVDLARLLNLSAFAFYVQDGEFVLEMSGCIKLNHRNLPIQFEITRTGEVLGIGLGD